MSEETAQIEQTDEQTDDQWLTERLEKGADDAPEPEPEPEAKPEKAESLEEPEPEKPESEVEKASRRGNPRYDPRARMLEATRESAELKRQLKERDQRIAEIEKRLARGAPLQESPDDPAPDPKKYPDTDEGALELIQDRAAWAARAEYRREREAAEKKAADQKAEEARSAGEKERTAYWVEKMEGFEKLKAAELAQNPDFLSGLSENVAGLVPSFVVQSEGQEIGPENVLADQIILAGKHAPALMRYFTEHDDEYQRIAALRAPRDVVREVAIIETRLDAAETVPAKRASQPSKAPPPIKPVQGSPSAADPLEDADNLSDDEYLTRRMKQVRQMERR